MPVSGGGLNTKFNTSGNIGFPPDGGGVGAGAATADLRHLGPKRTLVLVDGIRWVNESSACGVGSGATDLNTIPTSIIDHIEVLQDGASAIYGSDAIAGVINIITKKGYRRRRDLRLRRRLRRRRWQHSAVEHLGRCDLGELERLLWPELRRPEPASALLIARSPSFRHPVPGQCTNRCSSGTPQGRFLFYGSEYGAGFCRPDPERRGDRIPSTTRRDPAAGPERTVTIPSRPRIVSTSSRSTCILSPSERVGLYGQVETRLDRKCQCVREGPVQPAQVHEPGSAGADLCRAGGRQRLR